MLRHVLRRVVWQTRIRLADRHLALRPPVCAQAGEAFGMRHAGLKALGSLRMEKAHTPLPPFPCHRRHHACLTA